MRKSFLFFLILSLVFLTSGVAFASPQIPENVQVLPPDKNTHEDLAEFSGVWAGTWKQDPNPQNPQTKTTLVVVEKLAGNAASLFLYSGKIGGWTYHTGMYDPQNEWIAVPVADLSRGDFAMAYLWVDTSGNLRINRPDIPKQTPALFAKQD